MDSVWYDLQQKWGRRGWDFDLSIPQMQCIAQMPCAYCGQEPSNVHRLKYKVGGKYQRGVAPEMELRYSGLDRVDSSKGYVPGNVVPCCGECNGMKSKLPLEDFFALIERIRANNSSAATVLHCAATVFD
jgi:hypothetical protein